MKSLLKEKVQPKEKFLPFSTIQFQTHHYYQLLWGTSL